MSLQIQGSWNCLILLAWTGGFLLIPPPYLMHHLFCGGDVVWGRRGRRFSRAISGLEAHSSVLLPPAHGIQTAMGKAALELLTLTSLPCTRAQRTGWKTRSWCGILHGLLFVPNTLLINLSTQSQMEPVKLNTFTSAALEQTQKTVTCHGTLC